MLPREFAIIGSKLIRVYLNMMQLISIDLTSEVNFQPRRLVLRERDWVQLWALEDKITKFLKGETTTTEEWWLTQRNSTAGIKITLKFYCGAALVDIRYMWRTLKDSNTTDTWHFTKHGICMSQTSWTDLQDKKAAINAAIGELKAAKPYAETMFGISVEELRKVFTLS